MTQYAFDLRFRDAQEAVLIPCLVDHEREILRVVEQVVRERPQAEFEGIVFYAARI